LITEAEVFFSKRDGRGGTIRVDLQESALQIRTRVHRGVFPKPWATKEKKENSYP